ncbi:MAG TPA: LysR family transcriptional regulator, partial [Polyangiales bacterium]|nr:LysR family transcriptional regulator [Polyangiales bacterium]
MSQPFTSNSDRLELLHTFVRIVEAGSLSAAATQLSTTQPTVSRRLQLLERTLGQRLVQRTTHAMKLTDEGTRCFEHAKGMLERWQAIEADLRGVDEEPRGALRVVAPSIFGQRQLIEPIVRFLQRYQQVDIEWLLSDRLPDFTAEGVDCAVRVGAIHESDVVAVHLADLPRIVVSAPKLWGKGAPPQNPEALAKLPWLALQTFYRDEVALVHAESGEPARIAIRPRFSTDNLHAMHNAALAGLGACVASAWLVASDLDAHRLVQLAPAWRAASL